MYNEEDTLPELYRRVSAVMERMDEPVELILVNDGTYRGEALIRWTFDTYRWIIETVLRSE